MSTFFKISYSSFRLKLYVKALRVTKIVEQTKFAVAWCNIEAKYCFQRQSWPKYMRKTLVLAWNSASVAIKLTCVDKIGVTSKESERVKIFRSIENPTRWRILFVRNHIYHWRVNRIFVQEKRVFPAINLIY